ncbi:MAG: hypothetical protein MK106_10900 [Mariniblastus sp.]|nr:hypothetical protein [Mariniblastus sp.]
MSLPKIDEWAVVTVDVNSETVMSYEGFIRLVIQDDRFCLEPLGMVFQVRKVTPSGAILESQGRFYFAESSIHQDFMELTLTRPKLNEVVVVRAEFCQHRGPVEV